MATDSWKSWDFWNPLTEPLPEPSHRYRISICITCMNRLYDLAVTLPKNIQDNSEYDNLEIVVLDYNGSDGAHKYVMNAFPHLIESGVLAVFRTEEPKFYSMTHSRNMAFRLASGDVVNSVDADNFVNAGFASFVNRMANFRRSKAVFTKGKRGMHGRIGFWKKDFVDLGGYDESLRGYGHDDHDLMERAMCSGYKMMWYGGQFCDRIPTPKEKKGANMENKNWRMTEDQNKEISRQNIDSGRLIANVGQSWGKGVVVKNGKEEIRLC